MIHIEGPFPPQRLGGFLCGKASNVLDNICQIMIPVETARAARQLVKL
jgi:hypothetical protein